MELFRSSRPNSIQRSMTFRSCRYSRHYRMLFNNSIFLATLATTAVGHGLVTTPRCRGALDFQRGGVTPAKIADGATIDYCSHCLNAGGTGSVKVAGPWSEYKPMQGNTRGGFGICGDPAGSNEHMKTGRFRNPTSKPFVANYKAGGVANFEFDATTNHGGYLEFYLCDVENNPGEDIRFETFSRDCHYLKRVLHSSCEAGNDKDCGPIDPKFPGRWVLPCRNGAGDQGDQILGGVNGKMAYRIPNVNIKVGVIQMYWLTTNTCNTPDGFMQNYKYPTAWAGCRGDGGSVGGKPQHTANCGPGGFPEEFWNCADVSIGSRVVDAGGATQTPSTTGHSNGSGTGNGTKERRENYENNGNSNSDNERASSDGADTNSSKSGEMDKANANIDANLPKGTEIGGSCVADWRLCTESLGCCSGEFKCSRYWDSSPMCVPKSFDVGPNASENEGGVAKDKYGNFGGGSGQLYPGGATKGNTNSPDMGFKKGRIPSRRSDRNGNSNRHPLRGGWNSSQNPDNW